MTTASWYAPLGTAHCEHVEGPIARPRFCRWRLIGAEDSEDMAKRAERHCRETGHAVTFSIYQVGRVVPE